MENDFKNEEKPNGSKSQSVIIVLLILTLLCVGGLVTYTWFSAKKEEPKAEEKKDETTTATDNHYTLEKIDTSATSITIGSKRYTFAVKSEGDSSKNTIVINNKSLAMNNEFPTVNRIYIWYDILVVEWKNAYGVPTIYAYNKEFEPLLKLTNSKIGWYTEGSLNAAQEEYIRFDSEKMEIYIKNTDNAGGMEGVKEVPWSEVSCADAKDKYKNVALQEKLVYKYNNGKLSEPEKKAVVSLSDVVCK